MRILDVSPTLVWPPRNGSTARMYHLLSELSKRHQVRQFSQPRLRHLRQDGFAVEVTPTESYREYRNPSPIPAVASELCYRSWVRPQAIFSGTALRFTRPPVLKEWLGWAEVALIEFPWQFAYCRRAAPALPMVLASHNVEVLTRASSGRAAGVRLDRSPLFKAVKRCEQQAVGGADLILAVSEADREVYLRRYGVDGDRVVTIPNGTDTQGLMPLDLETKRRLRAKLQLPERPTVVYLSSGPKIPDVEGLKWVRRVAARRRDLSFLLVGGISARPSRNGNIVATGSLPDHRPYLQAADISLNPIEYGGGTKLKVLDGLAAGLATVVFAEAIHGTDLHDGEHVVVADKSELGLDEAIQRLLDEPRRAEALAAAGRQFVCERHDWQTIGRRLEAALLEFLSRSRAWGGDDSIRT